MFQSVPLYSKKRFLSDDITGSKRQKRNNYEQIRRAKIKDFFKKLNDQLSVCKMNKVEILKEACVKIESLTNENRQLENSIRHLSEICQIQSSEINRLLNENALLNQICQIQSSRNVRVNKTRLELNFIPQKSCESQHPFSRKLVQLLLNNSNAPSTKTKVEEAIKNLLLDIIKAPFYIE
ncbi:10919_t:CDS:2 [Gigaspora margarita]|uniref:10919_t:CDS:1 n=1 Tax=Gigaspora margarita TaxID=4874 RepID=A0ABN7UTB1_GIGMA|nr:10919_t:CDS:2 [Gigaspora margarita]